MPNFKLITLGGTIDANPYPVNTDGTIDPPQYATFETYQKTGSRAYRYLNEQYNGQFTRDDAWDTPLDSQDFAENTKEIARLVQSILASSEDALLITCGTDAMVEIARAVKTKLIAENCLKLVLFTGAMVPLSNGDALAQADAKKNLDAAVQWMEHYLHARQVPHAAYVTTGTYIVWHNQPKPLDPCYAIKDRIAGTFVERDINLCEDAAIESLQPVVSTR